MFGSRRPPVSSARRQGLGSGAPRAMRRDAPGGELVVVEDVADFFPRAGDAT